MINGADEKLPKGDHVFSSVYTLMLLQICRDYPGLPNAKELKARDIRFFYEGLRVELQKHK